MVGDTVDRTKAAFAHRCRMGQISTADLTRAVAMKSGHIMSTVFCAMSSELSLLCAGYHSVASVQYMSPQLFDQFRIDYFAGAVNRSAILYNEKPRVAITLMIYFVLLTEYEPCCDKHCLVNHATACMSTCYLRIIEFAGLPAGLNGKQIICCLAVIDASRRAAALDGGYIRVVVTVTCNRCLDGPAATCWPEHRATFQPDAHHSTVLPV